MIICHEYEDDENNNNDDDDDDDDDDDANNNSDNICIMHINYAYKSCTNANMHVFIIWKRTQWDIQRLPLFHDLTLNSG